MDTRIELNATSSDTGVEFVAERYPIRLMCNLCALRKNSKFCDVNIAVQNERFSVSFRILIIFKIKII